MIVGQSSDNRVPEELHGETRGDDCLSLMDNTKSLAVDVFKEKKAVNPLGLCFSLHLTLQTLLISQCRSTFSPKFPLSCPPACLSHFQISVSN